MRTQLKSQIFKQSMIVWSRGRDSAKDVTEIRTQSQ